MEAVVLDMDGVLIEGEEVWDAVREGLVRERGGHWAPEATTAMMGMSSPEWSRYMAEELAVPMEPAAISAETVRRVAARYAEALPLVDGAVEVVQELAGHWPLGLASSANRPIIELVLDRAGLAGCFRATVSSEEVARGKPAPDVYLGAAGCAAATLRGGRGLRQRPAIGRRGRDVGGGRPQPPLPAATGAGPGGGPGPGRPARAHSGRHRRAPPLDDDDRG
jgi:phosphoglycolate phosphatase-like HAD superfamily hydrolase